MEAAGEGAFSRSDGEKSGWGYRTLKLPLQGQDRAEASFIYWGYFVQDYCPYCVPLSKSKIIYSKNKSLQMLRFVIHSCWADVFYCDP